MQTTGLVRRVLGDAIGCITLIALTAVLIPIFPGMDVAIRNWPTVAGFLLLFAIISYRCWIQFERTGAKWLLGVLISVGLGLAFLPLDILFGRMFHPDLGVIQSTVSTLSFWLTMFVCPLGTVVFLSGWARSITLRSRTPHS